VTEDCANAAVEKALIRASARSDFFIAYYPKIKKNSLLQNSKTAKPQNRKKTAYKFILMQQAQKYIQQHLTLYLRKVTTS
jgi:hypothetical protein